MTEEAATEEVVMTEEAATEEVVMTGEVAEIAETIIVELTPTMTGSAPNVKTQISRLELNVTAVVLQRAEAEIIVQITGRVMIEGLEKEEMLLSLDQAIGIVHNVVNPTLRSEMIVSVAAVLKE